MITMSKLFNFFKSLFGSFRKRGGVNKIISLVLIFSFLSVYLIWPAGLLAGTYEFEGCPAYNGGSQGSDSCYRGMRGDRGSCEYGVKSMRGTKYFYPIENKIDYPEGTILKCRFNYFHHGFFRWASIDPIYPYTRSRIAGLSEKGYEVILEKGEIERNGFKFLPTTDGRYTRCTQYAGKECAGEIVYLDEYEKTLSSKNIPYLTKDCLSRGTPGKCVCWASIIKKDIENLTVKDVMEVVDKTDRTWAWTDEKEGFIKTTITSHVDYIAYLLTAFGSIYKYHKYNEEKKTSWGGVGLSFLGAIFGAFLTPLMGLLPIIGPFLASTMPILNGSIFANLTMFGGYLTSQALGKTVNLDGGELTLVYVPDYVPDYDSFGPQPSLISQTCDSVVLSIESEENYDIYRDGGLIASAISVSQKTYIDKNLSPHKTYKYTAKNSGGESQILEVYTKCLPQCTFSIDKEMVIIPKKATLSWFCKYADTAKINSKISEDKGGLKDKLVDSHSGNLEIFPQETSNWILTASNIDGEKSWLLSLETKKPHYQEIKP